MITEERAAAIESQLRSVTDDIGRLMDRVLQKGFIPAFRCSHSLLWLPGDYVKEYGRLYGIGLGPNPVSEVFDTDYGTPPPAITPDIQTIEQIMHPAGPCFAQVDFQLVAPEEFEAGKAILASEDPRVTKRAAILRAKQLKNPRGRLRALQAKWEGA